MTAERIGVLYLAPWLDLGGSDKGTLDWFRFLDRDRFRASLITTQPSPNRRLLEAAAFAEEVWDLPSLMPGGSFPEFILSFIHSRHIELVHVMNSRIGFELLPQIAGLPERPRVVVQLHVEEPDRSGYVRTVSTRFGNLIDAFSISSEALAARVAHYDVPPGKRRVIRTGVDARHEFAPGRATAVPRLDRSRLEILFPARLTAQKDPLLMAQLAARLRERGILFCIHSLGDGDLRPALETALNAAGLTREVVLHGEVLRTAPWYAGSDLVLLTSEFEGVPYVAYEAMAMGVPLVAPALPGLDEVVPPGAGILVAPRDDIEAYAAAVEWFAADPARRAEAGAIGRAHVLAEHTLERMAAEHAALYEELLAQTPPSADRPRPQRPADDFAKPRYGAAEQLSLRNRRPTDRPLVSVIVVCFNQGHYLPACLRSVAAQRYRPIETIVVDNGSSELATLATLADLRATGTTVIRLESNRGPGAARNVGIERSAGRYILPLDADNLLLDDAVGSLVEQLASAGERVGFVYPNYRFFGNRQDAYEVPSYNLDALLESNYCDTCSLFDREVFDRGLRYPEHLELAPEDWSLVLRLAEHGIRGEPARRPTFLSRKHGFTRSDLIDEVAPFAAELPREHAALFGRRLAIKAHWRPALTVVALDPRFRPTSLHAAVHRAERQSAQDFELILRAPKDVWPGRLGPRLRRLHPDLASSRAEALAQGVRAARGRFLIASYGAPEALLADRTLIEATIRRLSLGADAVAFAHGLEPTRPPLARLEPDEIDRALLSALAWVPGGNADPTPIVVPGDRPLETLARWLGAHGELEWRHLPRRDGAAVGRHASGPGSRIARPRPHRVRDRALRDSALPILPSAQQSGRPGPWTPPLTRLLCRHLNPASGRYTYTNHRESPPGHHLDHVLGSVRALPLRGTISLGRRGDGFVTDAPSALDDPALLGFVEQAPLPLLHPLLMGHHAATGQAILVGGAVDPLTGALRGDERGLGWVEPYPLLPAGQRQAPAGYGLRGLVRTVDLASRRHRYGVGLAPAGRLAAELGAVFAKPTGSCLPLYIDSAGRVSLPQARQEEPGAPSIRTAIRWSSAPIGWHDAGPIGPRMRATARRGLDSFKALTGAGPDATDGRGTDLPAGYLLRSAAGRTLPLYAAFHPVTGDQLLSTDRLDATRLGYGAATLLGYLIAQAPLTGRLGTRQAAVPWASHFGRALPVTV